MLLQGSSFFIQLPPSTMNMTDETVVEGEEGMNTPATDANADEMNEEGTDATAANDVDAEENNEDEDEMPMAA